MSEDDRIRYIQFSDSMFKNPSPNPATDPVKCTKCDRIITVWDRFDFPPAWIAKHPELKGMCMQCYQEWCESHAEAQ